MIEQIEDKLSQREIELCSIEYCTADCFFNFRVLFKKNSFVVAINDSHPLNIDEIVSFIIFSVERANND